MNKIIEQLREYSNTCPGGFSIVTRDWSTHVIQTFTGIVRVNNTDFAQYTLLWKEPQLQLDAIRGVYPEIVFCGFNEEDRQMIVTGTRTGTVYLTSDMQ